MILAIDTATRWAGLALHDGTAVIAEYGWRCVNTHTIELTPAIDKMLADADLTPDDLRAIAVTIGPGSYTGLRVGLALAKGLALANHIPLLGVPTLDIVVAGVGYRDGRLVVVAEAGRRRITVAAYAWQEDGWQLEQGPANETWPELLERLTGDTFFAGEISAGAAKHIRAAGKPFHLLPPATSVRRAGYLAELGWQRLQKGQTDDPAALAPVYMRDPTGKAPAE